MNKLGRLAILSAMSALWAAPPAMAASIDLSGPHYNLTILGSKTIKNSLMTGSNRQTIFVPLVTSGDLPGNPEPDMVSPDTAIWLGEGTPFQVCDGNAFDLAHACTAAQQALIPNGAFGAVFQLPCNTDVSGVVAPCTDTTTSATYDIFAEPLGKPGGQAQITTCATDIGTNTVVCSTTPTPLLIRNKAQSKFQDVTQQLTTLTCTKVTCPNLCQTNSCTFELFSPLFQGFFWDYDNNLLKNLQLRFYIETLS